MQLTGDVFLMEDSALLRQERIEYAVKQCGRSRKVMDAMSPWELVESCLPACAAVRLREYDRLRTSCSGPEGAFLADVEHWPDQCMGSGGPLFPAQLKHGTVVSWCHERVATGMEHLAAQVYHVFDVVGPKTPLHRFLSKLNNSQLKQLSGNGWSLAVCSWMLYVWSHTVRRPVEKVKPTLSSLPVNRLDSWENPEEYEMPPEDTSDQASPGAKSASPASQLADETDCDSDVQTLPAQDSEVNLGFSEEEIFALSVQLAAEPCE